VLNFAGMNSRILPSLLGLFAATACAACGANQVVSDGSGGNPGGGGDSGGGGNADGGGDSDGGVSPFRLLAPLSTATVSSRRPTLRWTLGDGSDGAHVQICRDRACTVEVTSFDASGASGGPSDDLPAGVSFWHAYPRHAGVTAPTPTATWEFTVGARSAPVDTSWGSALDVNGDGYADAVIGPHLYLGGPKGLASSASITLTNPSGVTFPFQGPGVSVGDVNGDGYADFLVKNPAAAGYDDAAYVFLGSASGLAATPSFTLGGTSFEFVGGSVAGAGDVNGDGYADILLGDPDVGMGMAYLYFGSATGPPTKPDITLTGTSYIAFGYSVAGAGDVNGDGYADIVIGDFDAGLSSGSGVSAYIFLGSASGPGPTPSIGLVSSDDTGAYTSSVACAGDVNGDGYADVLIGSSTGDSTGGAFLYLGSANGPAASPSLIFEAVDSNFGLQVAGVGDVDGDGYADIVIGDASDPFEFGMPVGAVGLGSAFLYLGGLAGPSTTPATTLQNPDTTGGTTPFAASLEAGDVDGDGHSDFITAVLGARQFGYVYLGSAGGLATTPMRLD
jgi:hypothetical protein